MKKEEQIKNIKNKLLNAVGKYSDYHQYEVILYDLYEKYNDTLETYNSNIWIGQSEGTIRDKADHMLRITRRLFLDMEDNARTELYSVLEEIMELDKEEQKRIWNRDIFLSKNMITEEKLEEMLLGWEDGPYDQEEALAAFEEMTEERIVDLVGKFTSSRHRSYG